MRWMLWLVCAVAPAWVAVAGEGTLLVESSPAGARVFLGTQDHGTTPATIEGLAPGKVAVTIVLDGYKTATRVADVKAVGNTLLSVELEPELGELEVWGPVGATVFLDGRLLTELDASPKVVLDVPAGKHEALCRHPEYEDKELDVMIATRARETLRFEPRALPGTVLVVTSPGGASLRVGGRLMGTTPMSISLPAGTREIEVTHLGYQRTTREVEIFPAKELVVNVDLPAASDGEQVCPAGTALIPAGAFAMGDDRYDRIIGPAHQVELDAYCIDVTEVTNQAYEACVDAGTCEEAPSAPGFGGPTQPVVGVRWDDARDYCDWVGGSLPTEAQWERAARGTSGRVYPWGNTDPSCSRAAYKSCRRESTSAVGTHAEGATPEGVHDLGGNVFEWVADWMDEHYYERSPSDNPTGPVSGKFKVIRGGGFSSEPHALAGTARQAYTPDSALANLGFRCACTP